MMKAWDTAKILLSYRGFSDLTPLWGNSKLGELQKVGTIKEWERCGLRYFSQLFQEGNLKTFQELRAQYALPNKSFFRYLQVRHALVVQFRGKTLEWSAIPILQKLINGDSTKGLISNIYPYINKGRSAKRVSPRYKSKWEKDVGNITDTQWNRILEMAPLVSLSPSQRMSRLSLLYRTYSTPHRLFQFGCQTDSSCPRCAELEGDLVHIFWRCPKLFRFGNGGGEKHRQGIQNLHRAEAEKMSLGTRGG